jgi:hypothetical protein
LLCEYWFTELYLAGLDHFFVCFAYKKSGISRVAKATAKTSFAQYLSCPPAGMSPRFFLLGDRHLRCLSPNLNYSFVFDVHSYRIKPLSMELKG